MPRLVQAHFAATQVEEERRLSLRTEQRPDDHRLINSLTTVRVSRRRRGILEQWSDDGADSAPQVPKTP